MYTSMMPPDMELFLCGWLRERLAEAEIDALVSNKEPDDASPFARPVIVVRDDGGPQLGSGVVFERGIGVSVVYGDRRADFEIMRLARLVYAWLTNPAVVMDEGSPVAWVDVDAGSNGPFRMVDEAGNARVYMTVEYHVTGELVEVGPPAPPPTGRLTFSPSPLALEWDEDATVTVTADGAPVPFDEALVSVGPDGVIEVYGSGGSGVWTVEAVAEGTATVAVSWTDPAGRAWEGVLPVTVEPEPAPLVFEAHPPILSMDEGETVGPVTFTLDGEPFPASSVAWETTGRHVRVSVTPDGTGCMVEGLTATDADGYSITFTPVNFAAEPATVTGVVYEPCQLIDHGGELVGIAGEAVTVAASGPSGVMFLDGPGSSLAFEPASVGRVEVADPIQATVFLDAPGEALLTLTGLVGQGEGAVMGRARIAVTVAVPLDTVPGGGWTQQPGSRWEVEIRRGETQLGFADVTMTADTPGVMTMVPLADGAGLGLQADETATAGIVTCLFTHTHEGVLYGARFTVTLDPALAGDVVVDPPTGPADWWPEPLSYRIVGVYLDSSLHYAQIDPVCEPAGLVEIEPATGEYKVTPVQSGTGRILFNAVSRDDPEEGGWRVFVGEWPFVVNAYIEPYAIPGKATMPPGQRHYLTVKQMDAKSRVRDIGSTGTGRTFTADPSGSIALLSSSSASELRFPSTGTGALTCTNPALRCDVTSAATTPLVCGQGTDIILRGQPVTLEFTYEGQPVPAESVEVMRAASMTNVGIVEIVNGAWTLTPVAEPNQSTGYVGFLMREPVESDLPGGEFIGHCVDLTVTNGLRVLPSSKTFDLDLPYSQGQAFSLMWGNRMLTAADNVTLVSITPASVVGSAYVDANGHLQLSTGLNPADWHAGVATIVLSAQPLQPSSARIYTAEITVTVTGGN